MITDAAVLCFLLFYVRDLLTPFWPESTSFWRPYRGTAVNVIIN